MTDRQSETARTEPPRIFVYVWVQDGPEGEIRQCRKEIPLIEYTQAGFNGRGMIAAANIDSALRELGWKPS